MPFVKLQSQIEDNVIFVIAGASGDLAKKFLYPALFTLYRRGYLPAHTYIVGYARSQIPHDEFIAQVTSNIKDPGNDPDFAAQLESYKTLLSYQAGSYDDGAKFDELNQYLESLEANFPGQERNRIFYLALPSTVFVDVSKNFKEHVYSQTGFNRLVVEKPIGSDLETALELVQGIAEYWTEDETFRIDHYLGQEIVKNLPVLRWANSFTSSFWDSDRISNVQITLNESFGTEGRGGYFDAAGIIRDVIQNHLCQVFSLVAMERPVSLTPTDIIDEKVKLLRAVPPVTREDTLLGQYIGYRDDPEVPDDSTTATYAANVLWVNNERWQGVPFILKAGKALNEDNVEIRMQFKDAPHGLFEGDIARSELIMRLEPGQAIWIKVNIKTPGFETGIVSTEMKLDYQETFPGVFIPDPYEVLLRDVLHGDHSTFVRDDELVAAWKIFTPILHWTDGVGGEPKPVPSEYARGSRGPEGLDEFLARYGFKA
ncbi:hypothetical protein GYMLUDRAFT_228465 [Collybiopsis luxurians FD-317 M1]|uniref:Glucose-6-phosphate 1-dehydrogenase n=1 Tax=Collybiopsis luxurians FD-317 M1 TaxID=944289 RepID=A0A0D0C5T4_9AGAR|nr:hypothetical protein GYMLUDRAFT_228465 [Collybiopsis luxurians FD-317 M1]